jgi:hypothetical protein
MSDRRQFLGTLGKALGFGGLLMPLAGKGVLALPADLGAAASLPVKAAPLPISPEGLKLRELRRIVHAVHLESPSTEARARKYRSLMVKNYRPLADSIAERSEPTWSDCVELAEICWQAMAKEWRTATHDRDGGYTGALHPSPHNHAPGDAHKAMITLVEAVLTLGNGERFDVRSDQGLFPNRVRPQPTDTEGYYNV